MLLGLCRSNARNCEVDHPEPDGPPDSIGGSGGESFVTPPTGKSCFVFVFALRLCVRACAKRREIIVYLGMSLFLLLLLLLLLLLWALSPYSKPAVKSLVSEKVV